MAKNERYQNLVIPTYVINLPERIDRLKHIRRQFHGRNEFDISIVEGCRHENGAIGLWQSIRKVIRIAIDSSEDVIVICEDDHEFTPYYNVQKLFGQIIGAAKQNANLLLGGISSFGQAIPVAKGRFWIDRFHCTQFTVVYSSFFQRILDEPFQEGDAADLKFSEMTSHKMVFHPYISVQHDFGYSDIPMGNLSTDQYGNLFAQSESRLKQIGSFAKKYRTKIASQ